MADTQLWKTLYQLKSVPRTGWLDRGIPVAEAESVADHSLFVAMICNVVAGNDVDLDANRVLRLALIHDVAESIAGDWPPYEPEDIPTDIEDQRAFFAVRRQRSPENDARKRLAEEAAFDRLAKMLPATTEVIWRELWGEYESQSSPEAQFVKQVDRLEAFIQSRIYAERYPDAPVDGFADMARQAITHSLLIPIRDAFLEEM